MKPPALQLMNVTKSYPGSPPVVALDTASVTIRSGEMVAVTGPSGSGKSTMLHIMGTLDRPTSGVVHVDGIDTSTVSDKRLAGIRAVKIGLSSSSSICWRAQPPSKMSATDCSIWACRRRIGRSPPDEHSSELVLVIGPRTSRTRCREGSASGWQSPGRWFTSRRLCWPTSRPAISTRSLERRSCSCLPT